MLFSRYSIRINAKVAVFSAILLTLWLNIAFVQHQLDVAPVDHSHHHCQLFSGAAHGLAQKMPELPIWISHNYLEPVTQLLTATRTHFAYLARSPPTP